MVPEMTHLWKGMSDPVVVAKKKAAEQWCQQAIDYCVQNGKKPWKYILVAHDDVKENMGLEAYQ